MGSLVRLHAALDWINQDDLLADIGCDHGLLSIYLANKYSNINIIASDVNSNALSSAISNIKNSGLEDIIETRLGNGLDVVSPDEIDTVVIAGMGSNTITGILKYAKDKLKNVFDNKQKTCYKTYRNGLKNKFPYICHSYTSISSSSFFDFL